jgi:hypothetical protein
MSSMTRVVQSSPGPAVGPVEPLGLGPVDTLGFVVACRAEADAAAVAELRGVCRWADLHRLEASESVWEAAVEPHMARFYDRRAERCGADDTVGGLEGELRLAGQGAFAVAEFAVTELAAALGMSEPAARAYVGQGLELRDRLPRLWGVVVAGVVPVWKARRVAEQTIGLDAATAAAVDAAVASFAHQLSLGRILKAVEAAVLRHQPDLAAARAAAAAERRGVWLADHLDGTTEICARTSTPHAHALDATIDRLATTLGTLGDATSREVRRAKALGLLADPQAALDLHTTTTTARLGGGPVFHLHLHTDALTTESGDGQRPGRPGSRGRWSGWTGSVPGRWPRSGPGWATWPPGR